MPEARGKGFQTRDKGERRRSEEEGDTTRRCHREEQIFKRRPSRSRSRRSGSRRKLCRKEGNEGEGVVNEEAEDSGDSQPLSSFLPGPPSQVSSPGLPTAVVAPAARQLVVAIVTRQLVVAVTTEQTVVARTAADEVVARAQRAPA